MNLREAYLYIDENKLREYIRKFDIQVRSIKFMLEDVVYAHVFNDMPLGINALLCAIKGEIISRYITNEISLKENHFYFRITDIEGKIFDIY